MKHDGMKHTDLYLYFECDNDDCTNFEEVQWKPELLVESGTPICSDCGEDMEYVGWDAP